MSTIRDLLASAAPDAPAIAAPDSEPCNFADLMDQVERTVGQLNALGVTTTDRAAIVLPNGPEMAAAFVSIACGATTAPLNPGYREDEFEFYLSDLDAKVLVVEAGSASPARAVAERLKIRTLQIAPHPSGRAGLFDFADAPVTVTPRYGTEDDIALMLHTSGTTSRPKLVPLSHRNLTASAANIQATLMLTPLDRCMNIMPLFHIHGLVASILASLGAGGSTYCTPGFNALRFFNWLADAQATWYTAVPTMHQAILGRTAGNRAAIDAHPLRFIRSCSAALPPQIMQAVEGAFGCPVIEAYAMTEAAHQMTSNPLPPAPRYAGSVGVAAGPEVAIMDEAGNLLGPDETGEVVIKGPNVTSGYIANPKANAEAFANGWFRTGDQGVMDGDGYLRITGRLKEIINRGGEKISPREIDEIILDHPAVAQIVTFAMPHDKLGEDVAAAVVLVDEASADAAEIRAFAAERLADFKVPRKVVFVAEIPKGPTGKLQRIGLAEKLAEELSRA